jgi:anti-anti-sigma factor
MPTSLTVSAARRDGTTVLTVVGEIDMSNIDTFTHALAEHTGGDTVTVDLSGVDYLDSGAINALFTYADHIRVVANPGLMPLLTISGLPELVAVEQSQPPHQPSGT